MPFTIVNQGTFTSTGVGVKIPIPSSADYMVAYNYTQSNTNNAYGVKFEWFRGVTPDNGSTETYRIDLGGGNYAVNLRNYGSAGFTYVTNSPVVEAQASSAITGITAASPAVVTQSNSYSEGDIIRIYNTTGMKQIAGMDFQISSVSGSGYTLIGLRAAGFAAPATAGNTRRISKLNAVEPEFLYVTEITKATSAVVRTSIDPTSIYAVGMRVTFSVPSSFGMTEINGLTGTITALSSANYTMTVDIDSSSFTTFAFPTSASSPTSALFATVAPAGAKTTYDETTQTYTGYDFNKQPFRTGQFTPYMYLSPGNHGPAGNANDVIVWQTYKMET